MAAATTTIQPTRGGSTMWHSLLVISACFVVSVTASSNSTMSSWRNAPWLEDILNLPADVPFPGSEWLNRLDGASSFTTSDGTVYSSFYAALLQNDPLAEPCRNLNAYINSVFIPDTVVAKVASYFRSSPSMAHYFLCYLRNLSMGMLVYYAVAGIFHYFCYVNPLGASAFANGRRKMPESSVIWHQIRLATASVFIYTTLPVVDEFLIEQGWTQAYHTVQEIGGYAWYFVWLVVYITLVEIGIYWMHRTLHTNKWMYRNIHLKHHVYNKPETLTPWASIAFHPIDGMLQASPYVGALLVCPCHYLTHIGLLFFTALWATYIHDSMDWNVGPIMGSKYHTVHHTHYIYNHGQFFTFCDRYWGTLRVPTEPTGVGKQKLVQPGAEKRE